MKKLQMVCLVAAALMLQLGLVASVVRAYTVYVAPTTCAALASPYSGIAGAPMPGPQDYPLYCEQFAPTGAATPTATPAFMPWVGGNTGWGSPVPSPVPTNTPTVTPTPA